MVVGMGTVREGAYVMTVTDRGQGRRTPIEEYPLQSRHGLGKINYKVNDVKGHVCGVKIVGDEDDLILISTEGIIIRIAVSDVNIMSRYASGVRVMRLSENDSVVTFARADHAEEETSPVEAAEEDPAAEAAAAAAESAAEANEE